MDNRPGIQAATNCEITIMHNIQHKEDSTKLINVANKSLNFVYQLIVLCYTFEETDDCLPCVSILENISCLRLVWSNPYNDKILKGIVMPDDYQITCKNFVRIASS